MREDSHDSELTYDQVLDWTFKFGKYKDQRIIDVFQVDKKYLDWICNKFDNDHKTKIAINLILKGKSDNINAEKVKELQDKNE